APRDRIKLACTLQLDRSTSAAAVRAVLEETRALFQAHPKIWPDKNIALTKIGEASLDIEILAWFETISLDEVLLLRDRMLLDLLEIVEKSGAKLAYPTRTIRMEGGSFTPQT